MQDVFNGSTKTGDIVTKFPKASQILKEYRIDFCCGGNRPIQDAIEEKNLNKDEILTKLNSLYDETQALNNKEVNWEETNYSDLIDYVVNVHHAYLNKTLPELAAFVTKVYRVHGTHHPELKEVYTLFQNLKLELEHHLIQEEELVFPKVRTYEQTRSEADLNDVLQTIDTLEKEHEVAGNLLKELREVTKDYKLPEGACTTYTLTYLKLDELESDLFQHIHLENNIMFPRLKKEA